MLSFCKLLLSNSLGVFLGCSWIKSDDGKKWLTELKKKC